jgi:diphthine synthase
MFYLIGLGLDAESLSAKALSILKKCKKVYLESYTVDFPYSFEQLEKELDLHEKIIKLNREIVEREDFLKEAKKLDIALLAYGSPLVATTHISLILKCKKDKIKYQILHNASIFDAITETGLQLYKFGKIASMPKFQINFEPSSFLDVLKENQSIKAHTLILTDINLNSKDALVQLEKTSKIKNIKLEKIIIISRAGTNESQIYYNTIENLKKIEAKMPFCIIIPSGLHYLEEEALKILREGI